MKQKHDTSKLSISGISGKKVNMLNFDGNKSKGKNSQFDHFKNSFNLKVEKSNFQESFANNMHGASRIGSIKDIVENLGALSLLIFTRLFIINETYFRCFD